MFRQLRGVSVVSVCWPNKLQTRQCLRPSTVISRNSHLVLDWPLKLSHICVNNGLSPGRHQAIIWTSAGILLIGALGINLSEILIKINTFSFKKLHLKLSSGKCRPFCVGLHMLTLRSHTYTGPEHVPANVTLVPHSSRWSADSVMTTN